MQATKWAIFAICSYCFFITYHFISNQTQNIHSKELISKPIPSQTTAVELISKPIPSQTTAVELISKPIPSQTTAVGAQQTMVSAKPSSVHSSKVHSSSLCFGKGPEKDFYRIHSCMYTNVCYYDGSFKFIVEDEDELEYLGGGEELAVDLVDSGAFKIFKKLGGPLSSKWNPDVVTRKDFLAHVGQREIQKLPHTHVYYTSYNAENFGHFISDELFPIYSLLSAFGELHPEVQLVRQPMPSLEFSCDWQRTQWSEVQWEKCLKNYARMSKWLTNKPVLDIASFGAKHDEVVCLDKLVAGLGMLSDHCFDETIHGRNNISEGCNEGKQDTIWQFREFTVKNAGVHAPVKVRTPKVIIWDRDINDYKAERKIWGLPDLRDEIQRRFHVEAVIFDFPHESVEHQVGNVSESAVHITGPGSGSFIGWFLPRGSTQIRIYPTRDVHYMEWFLFNYMPHIQVEHVPVERGKFDQETVVRKVEVALQRFRSVWPHKHHDDMEK